MDQRKALQWVRKYIHLFGGDPDNVIIWGESAGGGSVLHHVIADNGNTSPALFKNAIGNSVYLGATFKWNHPVPTAAYNIAVQPAGCGSATNKLNCLRSKPYEPTLRNAVQAIMDAQAYANVPWHFVFDNKHFHESKFATERLDRNKPLNGKRILVTNTANEAGLGFLPLNINNNNLAEFMKNFWTTAPRSLINSLLNLYLTSDFADERQLAVVVFQDARLICPGLWLNEAFTSQVRKSWKGTWAWAPALHAMDLAYYYFANVADLVSLTHFENWTGSIASFILHGDPNVVRRNPTKNVVWKRWEGYSQRPWDKYFDVDANNISNTQNVRTSAAQIQRCKKVFPSTSFQGLP